MSKNLVIEPCTCGRKTRDRSNLAVIIEEYHKGHKWGIVVDSQYSTVVCLNKGCRGREKRMDVFVEKLPKMYWAEYNKIKREENGKTERI